jgi:hypothetical protein
MKQCENGEMEQWNNGAMEQWSNGAMERVKRKIRNVKDEIRKDLLHHRITNFFTNLSSFD